MNEQNVRTDLALESAEMNKQHTDGVEVSEENRGEVKITRIKITNDNGEKALGKPKGTYVTIEVPRFTAGAGLDRQTAQLLADEINGLLPENREAVLVAGLGNTEITPDALGPKAAGGVLATRHIAGEFAEKLGLGGLQSVAVLFPGVLGKTGMETGEIILGATDRISPSAVIVVDALAARNLSRLGCTVQISDTGIRPGSGVGNARSEISRESLGVPVIAVGVPTVVDIKTLLNDVGGHPDERCPDMIVTPREVDMMIDRASELIAAAVNLSLQPQMELDDLLGLL